MSENVNTKFVSLNNTVGIFARKSANFSFVLVKVIMGENKNSIASIIADELDSNDRKRIVEIDNATKNFLIDQYPNFRMVL